MHRVEGGWKEVARTPSGVLLARTKHGHYPVGRDGQIRKRRRYLGNIDGYEVWEYLGQKRTCVKMYKDESHTC